MRKSFSSTNCGHRAGLVFPRDQGTQLNVIGAADWPPVMNGLSLLERSIRSTSIQADQKFQTGRVTKPHLPLLFPSVGKVFSSRSLGAADCGGLCYFPEGPFLLLFLGGVDFLSLLFCASIGHPCCCPAPLRLFWVCSETVQT